ncbi:TRAP transporter small permease [Thauera mechernichensis]|uniref:TRAP transporter small permease protein n=1 Tax=Thauera mechernichensis TaxID=82788 RepID=A0ABW3WAL2_9RHOO|nr:MULTISPECIES: TRAP transporter small permease [Thauera]MDG3064484.1 TRAP transporter small permease [Thauera mechernichensis]WBL64054.1 TRAP transporter small permease [Thauera sp. WB-2]HAG75490.1 C4-dicarboxylate ABC transporter permease [Thauera sp.]HAY08632.1 C4-dicarboxylate ABC transporter permease [Thauera sp.]HRK12328.1 TRAP transporter small permease [Thauera sp.]
MNTELPPSEDSPSVPYTIEQVLSGVVMGMIVLITFGNVLARYFTSKSFAATEEFSIALLIVLSFLGSSAAFAFDRHIRVSFFADKLPRRARAVLDWLSFAVTASLFAFIAFYAGKLTWDQYRFEETSPALGVPQWWYTVWMPVLALALVLRLVVTRLRRPS